MLNPRTSERRARYQKELNRNQVDGRVKQATTAQLRRLFGYIKPYTNKMVFGLIGMFTATGIGLVVPMVVQKLVDTVFSSTHLRPILSITIYLLVLFLVRSIFNFIEGYYLSYVGEKVILDIRQDLYSHLHSLSLRFFSERGVGEILSRLSVDVTSINQAVSTSIASALSNGVQFIGALTIMLVANWQLTAIILLFTPPVALLAVFFGRKFHSLTMELTDVRAEGNAFAEQALSSVRVVKAFTREEYEIDRYKGNLASLFKVALKRVVWRSAFSSFLTFLGYSTIAVVIWLGGRWVIQGRLTPGELVSFLFYAMMIAGALTTFSNVYTQVTSALGATSRIFELMDEKSEVVQDQNPKIVDRNSVSGAISFENVYFSYATERGLIKNFNLDVKSGELLAFVGPSGAGKTTVINLIPRFFDPQQGRVLLDGMDLKELDIQSLRSLIGLVPQEIDLFSGTLRENIQYGRLDATDDEIIEAAKASNAWEFIKLYPDQLDTSIGERGVMLSTGQRQRVAIARAVLKDPRILLLDEATSSLDSESEQLVQEALERLMEGRTSLVIAHRLSTIYRADRIAVINKGELIELGNHYELVKNDGLYARLHSIQFQDLTNQIS